MNKSILASKTFWLNVGAAAISGGLGVAGKSLDIPFLSDPQTMVYIMAGANIINRFFTKQPVNLSGAQDTAPKV